MAFCPSDETRASGIENAHCLVGQLASGEIAVRKAHAGVDSFVEDADVVMLFEGSHQAAHHDHALLLAGLLNFDYLEAAGQRGILLEVLLVFGPRGGRDGAQFAAGQGRLEQVGGVVLPRLAARADHGVGFVDEQNDGRGRGLHFFDQALEPILEFPFDARAGLQQRQVEGADMHVLQRRRHIALRHPQGEAFDHRGLAHARFTREDGVVLPAAGEDVDDLADLRDRGPAPDRSCLSWRCR